MCGIGAVAWDAKHVRYPLDVLRHAADTLSGSLAHRGPDGIGRFEVPGIILVHRRLSIVDLMTGAQPLGNEDGSCVVVFNGEIYNYRSLRRVLSKRHRLRTASDTECLVHLYEESGYGLTEKLNGMYAFALWDNAARSLMLAVDPVGIKPLYWWQGESVLIAASELRAVKAALNILGVDAPVNDEVLAEVVHYGWYAGEESPLTGVRRMRPGSKAEVRDGKLRWLVRDKEPPADKSLEDSELMDYAQETLALAVEEQLHADVPTSILLSGGIDSSLLVALAESRGIATTTFSLGFDQIGRHEHTVDETPAALAVAQAFGTTHHELRVSPMDLLSSLDDALEAQDEPLGDPAIVPLLLLCRHVRTVAKVCLTGDGGDELFGGYLHHQLRRPIHWASKIPRTLRLDAIRAMEFAARQVGGTIGKRTHRTRAAVRFVLMGPWGIGLESQPGVSITRIRPAERPDVRTHWDSLMRWDLDGPLASQMLVKTDRISMWAGIETRVPYLDRRVVQLARRLRGNQRVRRGQTKWLLRGILARLGTGRLQSELLMRRKHGFRVPLATWFRGPLFETLRDRLVGANVPTAALLQPGVAQWMLEEHRSGRTDNSSSLWALLAVDHWLRRLA